MMRRIAILVILGLVMALGTPGSVFAAKDHLIVAHEDAVKTMD